MGKIRAGTITGLFILVAYLWFVPSVGKAFEFGVIGDMPYTAKQEAEFPNLINDMNEANLAFVVHVGDFWWDSRGYMRARAGVTGALRPCYDETFKNRRDLAQSFKHPFILTPGDNEWTDCHKEKPSSHDPLERLSKLREMFFQGEQSLGQRTLQLTRQSNNPKYAKFRENVRWTHGGVVFVTLHIVGSNNNLGRTPEMDAEYSERNAANLVWMKQAFDLTKRDGSKAIVIFIQANPNFERDFPGRSLRFLDLNRSERRKLVKTLREEHGMSGSGYSDFLKALKTETVAFGKPVVLMHGDTHYFRIDKPMVVRNPSKKGRRGKGRRRRGRRIENFTRVETFGNPYTHWVRVIVDSKDRNVFTFKQGIVEKNIRKHKSD